jgi:hypothetical protein
MKLSKEQFEHFNEEGFLVADNALTDSDLDPIIHEYEEHIGRRAGELLEEGKISQLYEDEPFERRLACICRENTEIYSGLDIMNLRGKASFDFLRNDNLMDLIEGIIGPEIICSPIQHTRPKLPSGLTPGGKDGHVAPWHQDAGVTLAEADPYFILTVWIPLAEATPENGCMQIIPRVHGKGLKRHHRKPEVGTTIVDDEMPEGEPLTLPMKKGDVLLIHKEIPHRSTPNLSDTVRWSMDLRYQKTDTPTGRPFYPDFVVRSRSNPDSVLDDHAEWCQLWIELLEGSKGIAHHRWQ